MYAIIHSMLHLYDRFDLIDHSVKIGPVLKFRGQIHRLSHVIRYYPVDLCAQKMLLRAFFVSSPD